MRNLTLALLAGVLCSGCSSLGYGASAPRATALMRDANGRELGTLSLTDRDGLLVVNGTLGGLSVGTHGIHLHRVGRCEAPFATADAHWNPGMKQHGLENPNGPHAGDMMNIVVGADGLAQVATSARAHLLGEDGLLDADGGAVVVHASADDQRTDPSGNSGARVACGVVTREG